MDGQLHEENRDALNGWSGIVAFVSLYFLTGSFLRSLTIAIFVLVSTCLGYGRRWILRAVSLAAVLAIAVSLGILPPPEEWKDAFRDGQSYLAALAHRSNP